MLFYRDTLGMVYLGGWDRPDSKGALLSAGGNAVVTDPDGIPIHYFCELI